MLSTLLDRLTTYCPDFAVVAAAPTGPAMATIDAAAASSTLKTLLQAAVGSVYAVEAPEGKNPVDAIYRLVSAQPVEEAGVRLLTVATFLVTLRAPSYEALIPALEAVEAAIQGSAASISITDAQMDYDSAKRCWLVYLETQFAVPVVDSGGGESWPALLVSVVNYQADPAGADLMPVRQAVTRAYRLVILTNQNNLAALHAQIRIALLGWQPVPADNPYYYLAGESLSAPGGISAWADTYCDTTWINQNLPD